MDKLFTLHLPHHLLSSFKHATWEFNQLAFTYFVVRNSEWEFLFAPTCHAWLCTHECAQGPLWAFSFQDENILSSLTFPHIKVSPCLWLLLPFSLYFLLLSAWRKKESEQPIMFIIWARFTCIQWQRIIILFVLCSFLKNSSCFIYLFDGSWAWHWDFNGIVNSNSKIFFPACW